MKKIMILAVLLVVALSIFNCANNDEYEVPYGDFSSLSTYVTSRDYDDYSNTDKAISVNTYVSFLDLSVNPLSHLWTTPQSSRFLNKQFTENDSVYDKFIINSQAKTSSEKLINVLFTEPGIHEVTLTNTFSELVDGAVEENGIWKANKTFTIDVFADPNPAATVSYDGNEILALTEADMPSIENKNSWNTVDIEAGEKLTYTDLSTLGRITSRKWILEGGKPETSNKETIEVIYNKLGEFTTSIESIRKGNGLPDKTVTKVIPLKINVIPSTKPFELVGKIKVNSEGVISFGVTGEIESLKDQEGFFKVHVTNADAIPMFDQDIPVSTAVINSEDATIIELTLISTIYNTDDIEVSFSGGNIISVDARKLNDFGPTSTNLVGPNILVNNWGGFEDANTKGKNAYANGYFVGNSNVEKNKQSDPPIYFSGTEEKAFAGTRSMKYTSPDGVNNDPRKVVGNGKMILQGTDFSKPFGITSGKFKISYRIYLEEGNTMKQFKSVLDDTKNTNSVPSPVTLIWDIENLPRGSWEEVSQIYELPFDLEPGVKFSIEIHNADNSGVTGLQTMFFDETIWERLEPRL